MQRETTKIITPIGKQEIEIKTYVTGLEKRELTSVYLDGKIDFNTESNSVKGIDASLMVKAQDLALKLIVVSIDGKKEPEISIIDSILEMRSEDTDFIIKSVDEIQNGKKFVEKKTN